MTVAPAPSAARSLRSRVLGRSRDHAKQERAVLVLHDVTKQYPNGKMALRDVDLVIPEGDFVFLVGPSGAGKSTLIKLLIRDEVATKGAVVLDGEDVARLGRRQVPKMRRKIGIIFQDFKLLPSKTVWENVAFALEVTGSPRRRIRPAVDRVLALVGVAVRETPALGPVALWVPGTADVATRALLDAGLRLDGFPGLICWSRPDHPFDRYLPISLAVV